MAYIELHYGPYLANGIVRHRIGRLRNFIDYLREKGNIVALCPSIHWDRLEVIIALRCVFRCRLTFLSQLNFKVFGRHQDPVLERAIQAVEDCVTQVGRVGPNIKVPGIYKETFNIPLHFGSGDIHYESDLELIRVWNGDIEETSSGGGDSKDSNNGSSNKKYSNYGRTIQFRLDVMWWGWIFKWQISS